MAFRGKMGSGFSIFGSLVFCGVVLGLADNGNLPEQNVVSDSPFQPGAATHETRADPQAALQFPNAGETAGEIETVSSAPPTRSSFIATWDNVTDAKGYLLDVSTENSFSDYVEGYHDLDVGNVTGRAVTGLAGGTTYYFRVRAYTSKGPGSYSEAVQATTAPATGLTIHATFDSSITNNPNATAIEAMINRVISIYESLFSDPITIQIRFRYATTLPNGNPIPMGSISPSDFVYYTIPWNVVINALRADAKTSNDNLAIATLLGSPLSANILPSSANGRAIGENTPPSMFANGTVANGGPYDGIVTLNSTVPYQFTRPVSAGHYDAQRSTEHEIDEVIGFASHLNLNPPGTDLRPQDLFSWSSTGHRNTASSGTRYFSINGGSTNIVNFNQNAEGDFGDWLSLSCPQAHPYVQNAFGCTGQSSDISPTSPEGINLDAIGYDLIQGAAGGPGPYDFNSDGHPDYLLFNANTFLTVIWYMNNNVRITGANGPTLPGGWVVAGVADFNRDGHPDYLLFNPTTRSTVIWYMVNNVHVTGATGPTLPGGWTVVGVADFNGDGHPDYLLLNPATLGTVIWYMNNNVHVTGATGPTLPGGWTVVGVADFNGDGHPDYLLFNPTTRSTVIWYMNNNVRVTGGAGPTLPAGWSVAGAADFNGNSKPDYVLYNSSTQQTAIWYLNNNVLVATAYGPTLPTDWSLVVP